MEELAQNNNIDTYVDVLNNIPEISKRDIEYNIEEWVKQYIGSKFEFREYQKETIVNIVYNIANRKNKTQLIEAPTGSGKSLLNIISAGVLAEYYGLTSYILVSDLYLWKQYEDFVKVHSVIKHNFGMLKGQTGNYMCAVNHEDMRNADCRMAGISWASMFDPRAAANLGYTCANTCKYIKDRKKALRSKVVIMTYQLYHYMLNVVDKMNPNAAFSFKKRDIIFCDECHNIPGIVKNNFSPEIKYSDIHEFKTLYKYCEEYCTSKTLFDTKCLDGFNLTYDDDLECEDITPITEKYKWDYIKETFDEIWNIVSNENSNDVNVNNAITNYLKLFDIYKSTVQRIESVLRYKRQIWKEQFTDSDKTYYKACSWFRNTGCFWSDLNTCVEHTGPEYIIREIEDSRLLKQKIVKFSNVKEDYLCYYFLLNTSANQVLMSATIGGYDAFYENIGFKYVEEHFNNTDEEIEYTIIPSTFDFSKSPVIFFNRYKMSYSDKAKSLPILSKVIYQICENKFANEKGMIQTGSYSNAKELYDNAPSHIKSRMLLYDGSKDKTDKITLHQMSSNTILVGPTLVEGIDLPGEECRFIIILKVPYPVIIDKYVKEKMNLFPMWYNSTTSNTIIQGIGRGNRFKEDYCTTYILDACFLTLYNATKEQYPVELQNRIKIYN